jgi:hypothetical protein
MLPNPLEALGWSGTCLINAKKPSHPASAPNLSYFNFAGVSAIFTHARDIFPFLLPTRNDEKLAILNR